MTIRFKEVPDLREAEVARFWGWVERSGGAGACWPWRAARSARGYGMFKLRQKMYYAHRVAYGLAHKDANMQFEVDHMCHTQACVNPSHLRRATRKQNSENTRGPQVNNTSGVLGVSWDRSRGKYQARVMHRGKSHFAGHHAELADAAAAVRALRNRLFTHNDLGPHVERPCLPLPLGSGRLAAHLGREHESERGTQGS